MSALRLTPESEWRYFQEASKIHWSEIRGALPLFGERFLARLYHEIARSAQAGVWVVLQDDHVVGFLAGCSDIRRTYRAVLLRGGLALAMLAARNMFSLKLLGKLPAMFLYPFQSAKNEPSTPRTSRQEPELLAMAVTGNAQRKGVGALLVKSFESALRDWGASGQYRVTTVAGDERANRFYQKMNFVLQHTLEHHDLTLNLYKKAIEQDRTSDGSERAA